MIDCLKIKCRSVYLKAASKEKSTEKITIPMRNVVQVSTADFKI
jgi:hypothetical protein